MSSTYRCRAFVGSRMCAGNRASVIYAGFQTKPPYLWEPPFSISIFGSLIVYYVSHLIVWCNHQFPSLAIDNSNYTLHLLAGRSSDFQHLLHITFPCPLLSSPFCPLVLCFPHPLLRPFPWPDYFALTPPTITSRFLGHGFANRTRRWPASPHANFFCCFEVRFIPSRSILPFSVSRSDMAISFQVLASGCTALG